MAKQSSFVTAGRRQMNRFMTKSIDDLLAILDSKIVFPLDKNGNVLWNKLYAVVASREQVWNSATELMDMAEIDRSSNKAYKDKIVKGFKTTWSEMVNIMQMNIGTVNYSELYSEEDDDPNPLNVYSEDEFRAASRVSVTDDKVSSVAKAKVLAAKLAYQILNRIDSIENPEKVNEEVLKQNMMSASIAERYAD